MPSGEAEVTTEAQNPKFERKPKSASRSRFQLPRVRATGFASRTSVRPGATLRVTAALFLTVTILSAAIREVGPGKPFTAIGQVPWESLAAGDTVLIHWRSNAYQEKWVICRVGTSNAPITIRGVPGPAGQLPVIDGSNATTRSQLNYWNQDRGIVKIGGANVPPDTTPAHIVIENLEIRSARPPYTYRDTSGATRSYPNNAAAIYVEKGDHITLRQCVFQNCGNGLFVAAQSRDVLVEGNHIHSNGNDGSAYEHNSYTAAERITFQFNRYGPLRPNCLGNALKDRSAGLVVRYNWIEAGNRQLDLVDAEDSVILQQSPLYRTTLIYGNVLIEPDGAGNSQIVHYGGDSGDTPAYRKGTLYFYHNTVVSTRSGNTTLFRLSTNDEFCDCRNNIVFVTVSGSRLGLLDSSGRLLLTRNWLKPGFVDSHSGLTGSITNDGSNLTGMAPGFLDLARQEFRLATNSPCIDVGTNLSATVMPDHVPALHYLKHRKAGNRNTYLAPDLGAYELSPFTAWQQLWFGTNADNTGVAAEWADPDGDGITNLLEYAFLTDPLVASRTGLPAAVLHTTNQASHLAIQFTRRPAPAELVYTVQVSPDLSVWFDGSMFSDSGSVASNAWTMRVPGIKPPLVRLNSDVTAAPQRFLRVTVRETWNR